MIDAAELSRLREDAQRRPDWEGSTVTVGEVLALLDELEKAREAALAVIDRIISNWREVAHTEDGDLYSEALITLRTLEPLRSQVAASLLPVRK